MAWPISATGFNGTLHTSEGVSAAPFAPHHNRLASIPVRETVDVIDYSWISVIADYLAELKREGFFPGVGSVADRKNGALWPFYRTEIEWRLLMSGSRIMAGVNPHGGGFIGGLSSYIVSTGMEHKCTPRHVHYSSTDDTGGDDRGGSADDKKLCEMAEEVLDEFCERENFDQFQTQCFEESQIDGDFFPKIYDNGGYATLRRALPELVQKPVWGDDREWAFGIKKDPDDQEKALAIYEATNDGSGHGTEIPLWGTRDASQAHSVAWRASSNIPGRSPRGAARGLPLFTFGTRDAFDSSEKLLRNAGIGTANRLAYTFLRQWEVATAAQVGEFQTNRTDYRVPDVFSTGRFYNTERMWAGQIEDIPKQQTMVQPPANPETQFAPIVAAMLYRAAGQVWNAPEWLMSGDATNMAAYTAALVAGGPFVKRGTAAQKYYKNIFIQILRTVLKFAVWAGRLPERALQRVKIDLRVPQIEMRDRLVEANRNQILVGMGVKSRQMVAEEDDIDFERTMADNEEFARLTAPQVAPGEQPGEQQPGADKPGETRDNSGEPQRLPLPGAIQGKPKAGDLDPFGDTKIKKVGGSAKAKESLLFSTADLNVFGFTTAIDAQIAESTFSGVAESPSERRYYENGKQLTVAELMETKDSSGHEHKGKGKGGGQFTSGDSNTTNADHEEKHEAWEARGEAREAHRKKLETVNNERFTDDFAGLTEFDQSHSDSVFPLIATDTMSVEDAEKNLEQVRAKGGAEFTTRIAQRQVDQAKELARTKALGMTAEDAIVNLYHDAETEQKENRAELVELTVSEADLSEYDRACAAFNAGVSPKAQAYLDQFAAVVAANEESRAAESAIAEMDAAPDFEYLDEPDEPEEPELEDLPDEPERADYDVDEEHAENDANFKADHDEWNAECAAIVERNKAADLEYRTAHAEWRKESKAAEKHNKETEKAEEKFNKDYEKANKSKDRAAEKLEKEDFKLSKAKEKLEETFSDLRIDVGTVHAAAIDAISERLDEEESEDEEPEAPQEEEELTESVVSTSFLQTNQQVDKRIPEAEKQTWTAYTGPRGGKGWRNPNGDIHYGDKPPGHGEKHNPEEPNQATSEPGMTIYPDAETRNADWPKRTPDVWDGTTPEVSPKPVAESLTPAKSDAERIAEYVAKIKERLKS